MAFPLTQKLATRFEPEMRFFRHWLDQPRAIGSLVPTSTTAARKMASVVRPDSGLPVLELGPGTGVVTRAILDVGLPAERLFTVEFSPVFHTRLAVDFPGAHVLRGDAFDLDATLGDCAGLRFDAVISSLPLLNFPAERRAGLMRDLVSRIPPGRPVVQMSYGPLPPVPAQAGEYGVAHLGTIFRNIPPVRLWVYSRTLS